MAQPAFKQDQVTRLRGIREMRLHRGWRAAATGRRRHQLRQSRILELQAARAARRLHVVRTADDRLRMQMKTVRATFGPDVYPAIAPLHTAAPHITALGAPNALAVPVTTP